MFRMNGMKRLFFSVLTAIVLTVTGASAQNNDSYIQLTRISLIEGNVGYQRVPDEEWAAPSINMPLEPGDRIYTGRGGRAEIEFEEGSVLRLAENTDIEILALDEDFVQIRMLLGIASITVERNVDFEIATPAAAFITEMNGIYRFEVAEDGRSEAIVRKGQLETVNNNFTRVTRNGDLIRVYPDSARPVVSAYDRRDAWDEWTDRRDVDRRPTSAARRHIPDNVSIGVAELERHGRWVHVTNYGWGWVPYSVASSWSPYSVGRWVYRPRFGWTWVSYETWGWLPYHYGRWYRDARIGWAWFPGESITFRFWSPGLVVFYRGSGWVSWGPLGPGDYYDAAYYRYRRIYAGDLARVRLLAVRQPGNYINRNVRNAFQTVSMDHFRGVNYGAQNVNARRNDITQPWRQGNLVRGGLDVSPVRESFRPATDRSVDRPRAETNRPVVVRRTPSQASGNEGRFTQINNPRGSPAADRPGADRRNNAGTESATGGRSGENRVTPGVTAGNSSDRRDRQTATDPGRRTAPDASSTRRSNPDSSSRESAGENRDRPAASRPAASQENRQPERPNTTGDANSSARENSGSAAGGSSSGSRERQATPVQRNQSAPEAPAIRRNNPDASPRSSAGETSDRATASRPAASQETRPNTAGTSSSARSTRENNAVAAGAGASSSGGVNNRQVAPAQRSQPATSAPAARQNNSGSSGASSSGVNRQAAPAQRSQPTASVPAVRQNNPGPSVRNSSPGQSSPRAGQQTGARPNRSGR